MSEICNARMGTANGVPFYCTEPKGHKQDHKYLSPYTTYWPVVAETPKALFDRLIASCQGTIR